MAQKANAAQGLPFSEFRNRIQTSGGTPWTGGSASRKDSTTYTGQHKHGTKRRYTCMARVGFEPTIVQKVEDRTRRFYKLHNLKQIIP
jgi:hypothetical protein